MSALPPVDRYEELVLSSFPQALMLTLHFPFFLSLFLLLSLATGIVSHMKLLTLFFPFICSETSENTSSHLPPTLSICVQFGCQKPTSKGADEHKGSWRGNSIWSTEQKSHLFKSEIGIKKHCYQPGKSLKVPRSSLRNQSRNVCLFLNL